MEKTLSRRNFIKGMLAGTATMASAGILSAYSSANAETAAASGYIPGTYSASAQGIGNVTVTMTFDESSIIDVIVDVSEETPDIGGRAGEDLAAAILSQQSADIDGVSGATVTSAAARRAAQACIDQARGLASAQQETAKIAAEIPAVFSQSDIDGTVCELGAVDADETRDFEIVVVGAGAAGVPAAGAAAESGAHVALLNKQAAVVSQGNWCGYVVSEDTDEQGIINFLNHTNTLGNYRADKDLVRVFCEYSETSVKWVIRMAGLEDGPNEEKGLAISQNMDITFNGLWQDHTSVYDYGDSHLRLYVPMLGPKPKNMGNILQVALDRALEENSNLEVFYSTPAINLIVENGKVTGVIAKDADGRYIRFNASKGVILATGDYQNNASMVKHFCPDMMEFDKKQYQKTGDGHVLAVSAGAQLENLGHSKMAHDFDSGLMYEEAFLGLNMEGERFMNEDSPYAYVNNMLRNQPRYNGTNVDKDHPEGSRGWYCQIYDADYMTYAKAPIPDAVMTGFIPGVAPEGTTGIIPQFLDTHKADTLEELAEMLGLDPEKMIASVERYNELCDKGLDTDFGKDAEKMHPVRTAPFWGIRRHLRCSAITSGVATNANGQALREDGSVVEGLYCVGNLGGNFYGGADYPLHAPGLSLGRCIAAGWKAGKHAAGDL